MGTEQSFWYKETLTHIVKQAEAQTGAPTATVTRELAKLHSEGAAPRGIILANQLTANWEDVNVERYPQAVLALFSLIAGVEADSADGTFESKEAIEACAA